MPDWYESIHADDAIRLLAVLVGVVIGMSLAFSDWRSNFTIGGIFATLAGAISTPIINNVETVQRIVEQSGIVRPAIMTLNIALMTFLTLIFSGALVVFFASYIPARRSGDPEASYTAWRLALSALMGGLNKYALVPPHVEAANTIRDLEKHNNIIQTIQRVLAQECTSSARSFQHFKDTVEATGRVLLQFCFGDSASLQHYRMAIFESRAGKLEYLVAINNRDWTAHSMRPFDATNCVMGEAIAQNRPLVYPRNRKWRTKYAKRPGTRYRSFVAIPIPCGPGAPGSNIGALTVDFTGADAVFTDRRIAELYAFAQLVHSLYVLNGGGKAP